MDIPLTRDIGMKSVQNAGAGAKRNEIQMRASSEQHRIKL